MPKESIIPEPEFIDGKKVVCEFDQKQDLVIPGHAGIGLMRTVMRAINKNFLGRHLRLKDDETTIGAEKYQALQKIHHFVNMTHRYTVHVKVLEDGHVVISIPPRKST